MIVAGHSLNGAAEMNVSGQIAVGVGVLAIHKQDRIAGWRHGTVEGPFWPLMTVQSWSRPRVRAPDTRETR